MSNEEYILQDNHCRFFLVVGLRGDLLQLGQKPWCELDDVLDPAYLRPELANVQKIKDWKFLTGERLP